MSQLLPGMTPPAHVPARPKDSSVVVLYRRGPKGVEVFWLRREKMLRFAAGFFAFPGGRLDAADGEVPVQGATGQAAALLACAARELFEETGVLLGEGAQALTQAQRDEERRALLDERTTFAGLLARHGVHLAARHFSPAGRWVTPPYLPGRFDARFFLVEAPPDQDATVWPGELAEGAWVRPEAALARWEAGTALLHPPNLHALRCLAAFTTHEAAVAALLDQAHCEDSVAERLEFQRGVRLFPQRTLTLPPATHTTAYLLGTRELLVVDPGAVDDAETDRLDRHLAELEEEGFAVVALLLTHHHGDHVGGARRLVAKNGWPVWAHRETAARLDVKVDRLLTEGEVLTLDGPRPMRWQVWHTPGHAPGHLALIDEASRAAVVGDLVAGVGTIVIDPHDGDMGQYLAQLERLKAWPIGTLYPAHGSPIPDGVPKLDEYLAHRAWRRARVEAALRELGAPTWEALVARAYDDVAAVVLPLAELNTRAIVAQLVQQGRARVDGEIVRPT